MRQFDIGKIEKEKESVPSKPQKRSAFLPYLLGVLFGVILIFGLSQLQMKNQTTEQVEPVKETVASEEIETKEEETKNEETVPVQTPETPPASTILKSQTSIQVLNGNGIRGDAYKIKTLLEKDGWKVKTYGNASSFAYQNTLVYYKPGQEEVGKAVAETLKNNNRQTALHESTTLKNYDILVIVGKK